MRAREASTPAVKPSDLQVAYGPETKAPGSCVTGSHVTGFPASGYLPGPAGPSGRARLVVAVPARNEEGRIARTLRALGEQRGEDAGSYRVVLLANNCTDRTAARAREVSRSLALPVEVIEEDFPPEQAHIGHARGRALQLAASRLEGRSDGLLATTDADTVVAPDWASNLRAALGAADLVGGRILTLPEERDILPRHLRRLQLQDAAYHLLASRLRSLIDPDPSDPWPRHHQHFGANMGLRLSAWELVKVWPQVRCLEDVALVNEVRRLDLRVRHCPQVRAWTSAREHGRVEVGLSSQLREWQELQANGRCWRVPGVPELRAEARATAALRRAWTRNQEFGNQSSGNQSFGSQSSGAALASLWLVEPGELQAALDAPTLGRARELAFHARHESGRWSCQFPPEPLEDALHGLRVELRLLERPGEAPTDLD
jgi:hypothetical protein